MPTYNLTEDQKDLLRIIVENKQAGKLDGTTVHVSCAGGGCEILYIDGNFGYDLLEDMDALFDVDLLGRSHRTNSDGRYSIKQSAYEAIKNNFEMPDGAVSTQFNIGAIVGNIHGGNFQAVGNSYQSEIQQLINDPAKLNKEITERIQALFAEAMPNLSEQQLGDYVKALDELRANLESNEPSPPRIERLIKTLSFMGDIEGSISLIARVLPYLYPLVVIATEKLGR